MRVLYRRLLSAAMMTAVAWLAPSAALGQSNSGQARPEAAAAPAATPAGSPQAASQGAGTPGAAQALTLQGAEGRQEGVRPTGAAGRPTVTAIRTTQPPSIDGTLDDAVWRTAAKIDTFVQARPLEGTPSTEKTEVHVAYDNEKVYFAIYAHYSDLSQMRASRVDRDKTDDDDTVTVSFDSFLDQQLGYSFSVNGYGVQGDSVLKLANTGPSLASSSANAGATGDTSWNALFTSAGQLVADGWTAEMAIPFKSLRYPARGKDQAHRWGLQVERQIRTKNEVAVWSPMSRDVSSFLRQMGTLAGMTNLSTSRNFEVLPTFTAVKSGSLNSSTGEYTTSDLEEGGVNVKYGLTSTLTFDFTYNPDFSQIESDTQQIEVNQRFPINYPELRPFFLEGIDTMRIGGPAQFIQTRTIVDPQFGAKLTGKIGKTTMGFMLANDEAPGKVDSPANPAFNKTATAAVARIRYDYRPENSIGVLYTDREFLNSHSRLIGFDNRFRQGQYYASYIGFITDRKDLAGVRKTGNAFEAIFRKDGRNLNYSALHIRFDPDYGTNLGFVNRVDRKSTNVRASYRWWPETWLINWGPEINYNRLHDYAGVLQDAGPGTVFSFQFAKNINASTTFDTDLERYRDVEFHKKRVGFSGSVNTSRKLLFSGNFSFGDGVRFVANPFLGRSTTFSATATFRPISRLQSVLKLDSTRFRDPVNHRQEFDVKILRSTSTYQFTPRLLVRNITEFNVGLGSNHTLFENILVTYRVNSGTVFYVGYDDRYKEGDAINAQLFRDPTYQRTNRSVFTKIQYLFRSGGAN